MFQPIPTYKVTVVFDKLVVELRVPRDKLESFFHVALLNDASEISVELIPTRTVGFISLED